MSHIIQIIIVKFYIFVLISGIVIIKPKAQIKQKLFGVLNKEIRLKTVQWLRACSILTEDLSSIPKTHIR